MKSFKKIMLIVGLIIGSGFASGKEIAVFFSRFGSFSYIFIPIVFLMFFGAFYWLLSCGYKGNIIISSSKLLSLLYIFICIIFTSSMFAGTRSTIKTGVAFIDVFTLILLVCFCVYVSLKEIGFLTKLNAYLIPFTLIILIACLVKNTGNVEIIYNGSFLYGIFFSVLYVFMNLSTGSFVISQIGDDMSKKERLFVSLFSSLILSLLLLFINTVLLSNPESLNYQMPLLDLSNGVVKILMRVVIFVGCLTTLLSLIYISSQNLSKLKMPLWINIFLSVLLPFATSFLGFGSIVSNLYPVVSVLGIFLLIPFFVKK